MTPFDTAKPEPTYRPLPSVLGHSIFTMARKIACSSSGGRAGDGDDTAPAEIAGDDDAARDTDVGTVSVKDGDGITAGGTRDTEGIGAARGADGNAGSALCAGDDVAERRCDGATGTDFSGDRSATRDTGSARRLISDKRDKRIVNADKNPAVRIPATIRRYFIRPL